MQKKILKTNDVSVLAVALFFHHHGFIEYSNFFLDTNDTDSQDSDVLQILL